MAVMQAVSRYYDFVAMVETVPSGIGAGVGPIAAGSADAPALGDVKSKEVQPEKGQHTGKKELAKQDEGTQAQELQKKLEDEKQTPAAPAAPAPAVSRAAASSQAAAAKNAGAAPSVAAGAGASKRSAEAEAAKGEVLPATLPDSTPLSALVDPVPPLPKLKDQLKKDDDKNRSKKDKDTDEKDKTKKAHSEPAQKKGRTT